MEHKKTLIAILIFVILFIVSLFMQPSTPMEYAEENNLIFNGTHYISINKTDGFNRVCLKHPHFETMPTSCKWMK